MKLNNSNAQALTPSIRTLEGLNPGLHGSYHTRNASSLSNNIVAINQSRENCHAAPAEATHNEPLVISDGEHLSRIAICEMLSSAAQHLPYETKMKLTSLVDQFSNVEESPHLDYNEKKQLLRDLYKIRCTLPNWKKDNVAKAIRSLEKLVYSSLLNDKLKNSTQLYRQNIDNLSTPGATRTKNVSAGLSISCGASIADTITAIKGTGKIGYTRTYITDSDDEGTVASAKEDKYQLSLDATASMNCTDEMSLQAGGEVSAKKTITVGVNYAGGATDYYREKYSHKMFSYKKHHIRDALFTRKHSLLHHQWQAQNTQSQLKESWSKLIGKSIDSKSPVPFQAEVTPKHVRGVGYTANVHASAKFSSLATAGAKLQYDYARNDIKVDLLKNMFTEVIGKTASEKHLDNLNIISQQYAKAFETLFSSSEHLKDKSISDTLSNDDIQHAVNALSQTVEEYSQCVQKYNAGDSSEGKRKHAFEKAWGVKESGRHGFLQSAEVMLTTFAAQLKEDDSQGDDVAALRAKMVQLNNKIAHPEFTHSTRKLRPLISFNNLLSIKNHSHTVTAELNASLGNDTVRGGGKISIAVTNKHTDHPYRIRAGEQRMIEITLTGNVTLSNLLSKLTEDFASEAGVALSTLHSAVTDAFSSSIEVSQGLKIVLQYFSPEWSNDNNEKPNYMHQATYLQSVTNASSPLNLTLPAAMVGGGINLGAGFNHTNVISQKMGTDTLNYLMLRYNYCKGKKQEQPAWQHFVADNKKNLVSLMKNIMEPGTNSAREVEILIKEKSDRTPDFGQTQLWNQYEKIRQDFVAAQQDEKSFEAGLQGLITLMDWHKETTDELFNNALIPNGIAKPQKNILQKAITPLRKINNH
ncbi:hypothetical protein [Lelliottia sp. WAP21]|uniref:hypothetical protein n=1 Tax=Lelliottia sp. WAP21 TaxID=2877426 RepID=UPI001E2C17A3|nr:hypothetical protein [Lelliottia sp. WAP21]